MHVYSSRASGGSNELILMSFLDQDDGGKLISTPASNIVETSELRGESEGLDWLIASLRWSSASPHTTVLYSRQLKRDYWKYYEQSTNATGRLRRAAVLLTACRWSVRGGRRESADGRIYSLWRRD